MSKLPRRPQSALPAPGGQKQKRAGDDNLARPKFGRPPSAGNDGPESSGKTDEAPARRETQAQEWQAYKVAQQRLTDDLAFLDVKPLRKDAQLARDIRRLFEEVNRSQQQVLEQLDAPPGPRL
jgi:hypothetical protein